MSVSWENKPKAGLKHERNQVFVCDKLPFKRVQTKPGEMEVGQSEGEDGVKTDSEARVGPGGGGRGFGGIGQIMVLFVRQLEAVEIKNKYPI